MSTTGTTTASQVGQLIPQPHGGALRNGGTNRGGYGSPPSVLRDRLRGSFDVRIPFLEAVADGEVMQKIKMRITDLLPHADCPKCGDGLRALPFDEDDEPEVWVQISADVRDRLKATDTLAKYGLGAARITEDDVKAKLRQTVEEIRDSVPALVRAMSLGRTVTVQKETLPLETPEQVAEVLLKRLEQFWT